MREIETGCRNPLVAMGVIGRNRASRGNWRYSDRSERDMFAGAKGRRRNAMVRVFFKNKKRGFVLSWWCELSQGLKQKRNRGRR